MATILPGGARRGALTVLGQEQARSLGQWLRERYVDQFSFLPDAYRVTIASLLFTRIYSFNLLYSYSILHIMSGD